MDPYCLCDQCEFQKLGLCSLYYIFKVEESSSDGFKRRQDSHFLVTLCVRTTGGLAPLGSLRELTAFPDPLQGREGKGMRGGPGLLTAHVAPSLSPALISQASCSFM
jgi:hypothetical protein